MEQTLLHRVWQWCTLPRTSETHRELRWHIIPPLQKAEFLQITEADLDFPTFKPAHPLQFIAGDGSVETRTLKILNHLQEFQKRRFIRRVLLDKPLVQAPIVGTVEQNALRVFAIPAGPADFLAIFLQCASHRPMHDVSDIRLVDAHAEGVRRDDDV